MELFTGILGTLLIFGVIVVIHEFGHFIAAKRSGMGVYEFSIGFGPALFKKEVRGTLYALRIIPVGGYVRIAGMEPGDEDAPNGYEKKPFFAKFATIAAGATMNFILAFVVIVVLGMLIGMPKEGKKLTIAGVIPKSPAAQVGIQVQDQVIEVAGKRNPTSDEATDLIEHSRTPIRIVVLRDGKQQVFFPKPERKLMPERKGLIYRMSPKYRIGVVMESTSGKWETVGFKKSVVIGVTSVGDIMVDGFAQFLSIVTGNIPLNQLSGPVGIMKMSYDVTKSDHITQAWFANVFQKMALLSVLIGFFNILPLPALDGGRLFLLVVEGIRGKALNKEVEAKIHAVGLALLLGLVFLVSIKDVLGLFRR